MQTSFAEYAYRFNELVNELFQDESLLMTGSEDPISLLQDYEINPDDLSETLIQHIAHSLNQAMKDDESRDDILESLKDDFCRGDEYS